MSVRVSVCLPNFNGAQYLAGAIDSVLAQTYADFELLIADDNSTDNSREIIADFAQRDQRIFFWTNEQRLGLFGNYNACLRKARGSYIKPFAHDDLLEPNALARLCAVLEGNPQVSLVSSERRWIGTNGEDIDGALHFVDDQYFRGKDAIIANLVTLSNWVGEPSAVMFRARDRGDGFDESLYHYGDIEYWFRLLAHGDLFYLSQPICRFRRHLQSNTTINLAGLNFAMDIFRIGERYRRYLDELGESREHFMARAIEKIALQMDHLVRNENLDLPTVIAARPAGHDSYLRSDNDVLREVLFASTSRVTSLLKELLATQNELEHRQAECVRLRAAVDQMSNSVSWRLTAPLRTVRERIGSRAP
jgi:glycosyltransferase involved in cell wall biosynthesis